MVAEGRVRGRRFRIIYTIVDGGVILPLTVFPITGFPIKRRGVTTSGMVAGLALQAAARDDIDQAIDVLIQRGILVPA